MTHRLLPVLAPTSHASGPAARSLREADKTPLVVDERCIAIVCAQGLDAAAAWVTGLLDRMESLGCAPVLIFDARRPPVGALGRALAARGRPTEIAGGRVARPAEQGESWILWVDDAYVLEGPRLTLVLTDFVPSQAPRGNHVRCAYVQSTRLGAADALALGFAGAIR
jgi:hypothetical protein